MELKLWNTKSCGCEMHVLNQICFSYIMEMGVEIKIYRDIELARNYIAI